MSWPSQELIQALSRLAELSNKEIKSLLTNRYHLSARVKMPLTTIDVTTKRALGPFSHRGVGVDGCLERKDLVDRLLKYLRELKQAVHPQPRPAPPEPSTPDRDPIPPKRAPPPSQPQPSKMPAASPARPAERGGGGGGQAKGGGGKCATCAGEGACARCRKAQQGQGQQGVFPPHICTSDHSGHSPADVKGSRCDDLGSYGAITVP
jgi:hypothetical protein